MFASRLKIVEVECAVCRCRAKAQIFQVDMTDDEQTLASFMWLQSPNGWWLSQPIVEYIDLVHLDLIRPHVRCPNCFKTDGATVEELPYEPVEPAMKCTCKHRAGRHPWGQKCTLCDCTRLTLTLPLSEIFIDEELKNIRAGGPNEALRASIAQIGQQAPVLVTPITPKLRREKHIPRGRKYYLVSGFGRFEALESLKKKTIQAHVQMLSSLDIIRKHLESNRHTVSEKNS